MEKIEKLASFSRGSRNEATRDRTPRVHSTSWLVSTTSGLVHLSCPGEYIYTAPDMLTVVGAPIIASELTKWACLASPPAPDDPEHVKIRTA